MKLNKLIALLLAVTMLFAFVGCPNEPDTPATPANNQPANNNQENPNNNDPENPPPVEGTFDIKEGLVPGATSYEIKDLDGLKKLIEIVNGKAAVEAAEGVEAAEAVPANSLAGVTITLANDLTINAAVLKEGFLEPDEGEGATANAALINLDSIGNRNAAFAGTFDGNGKVISGLYIYQAHQGLGFIGATAEGAVIKNLTIKDACVINSNASAAEDGPDDDRFGGLLGMSNGATTIENCVFIGVVGSAAAAGRGDPYEYIGGLVGRADGTVTAKDCVVLARVYGSADVINKKGTVNKENVIGLNAASVPVAYEGENEIVKAAVAAINPAEDPNGNTEDPNGNTEDPNGNTEDPNGNTEDPNGNTEDPNGNTEEPADTKENDIAAGLKDNVVAYNIYDVAGLQKLAEIVNGGNALDGYTFTVANDITINENVLSDDFLEPAESALGEPAANLVNLESIGKREKPFSGTFDGNGKIIKGLYIYQGHQGLGFFGSVKAATIKNVIILDACVVNKNMEAGSQDQKKDANDNNTKKLCWWDAEFPEQGTIPKINHDGNDDDRFGGLIGLAEGVASVENCIFEGVVGSAAAANRTDNVKDANGNDYTSNPYEYIGGLVGRADAAVTANHVIVLARIYGSGGVICTKGTVNQTEVAAFDASDAEQLAAGKAAIAEQLAALSAPAAEEPAAPEEPAAE